MLFVSMNYVSTDPVHNNPALVRMTTSNHLGQWKLNSSLDKYITESHNSPSESKMLTQYLLKTSNSCKAWQPLWIKCCQSTCLFQDLPTCNLTTSNPIIYQTAAGLDSKLRCLTCLLETREGDYLNKIQECLYTCHHAMIFLKNENHQCWWIPLKKRMNHYLGASSVTISLSYDHPRWKPARMVVENNWWLCQR